MNAIPTLLDVYRASSRIRAMVKRTPLLEAPDLA